MMRKRRWILAVMLCGITLLWAGCQNPALTGAKVYIQQQDWDNALVQLKIAVEQEPQNAEARFLLGRAYSEKAMYPEMVKAFRASLEISEQWRPNIERIRDEKWTQAFNRGVQAGKEQDFDKAAEEFTMATVINPENPDAFNNLGYAYTNLERLEEALQAYSQVFELDPDNVAAKINSGVIYFKQGKSDKAAGYFEGALKSEPGNKSALTMWALSLETMATKQRTGLSEATTSEDSLKMKEQTQVTLDKATEVYLRAIEAHPEDKNFAYNLGVLYAQQLRDYQAAVPMFQKVTEMDPEDVDAWFNLATAQLSLGDLDGAQPSLEKAIELEPDNGDAWYQLGIIYIKKGMKTQGEDAFKRAEEIRGDKQ